MCYMVGVSSMSAWCLLDRQVHNFGQQQWRAGTIGGLAAACRFSLLLLHLPANKLLR